MTVIEQSRSDICMPTRQVGNIYVERNNELKYTYYAISNPIGQPTEVYVSDELRNFGLPFKRFKDFLIAELLRVKTDPFGETSIDPHVADYSFREQRAVNRLKDEIQAVIGQPIAIKSQGVLEGEGYSHREDLVEQYLFMRQLQLSVQDRLTDKQKATIEFLPVYGAVRVGHQDFLIMKYIQGAREIEDQVLPFPTFGWIGSGDPISELAFSVLEHRDLIKALGGKSSRGLMRWRHVTRALRQILGTPLHDLAGRNVLCYQNNGNKQYVIIDQKESG